MTEEQPDGIQPEPGLGSGPGPGPGPGPGLGSGSGSGLEPEPERRDAADTVRLQPPPQQLPPPIARLLPPASTPEPTQPLAQPTDQPTARLSTDPSADPTALLSTDPSTDPAADPSTEPAVPPDRWRTAAVALLNLGGLGLGYALMRRWWAAAACWLATGLLLRIALPVNATGVALTVVVLYLLVLALAAALGALRSRRTALSWPRSPRVAVVLAVVLLALPVASVVLYQQAYGNAVQTMLLGRLSQADQLVASVKAESFATAEPEYAEAVATYRDLLDNHRDSRAGRLVPARLDALYQTVAVPYTAHDFCDAIAPLAYLRTLPSTFAADDLGSLASWPNDPLAASLYQCGVAGLGVEDSSVASTDLGRLITTFPNAAQSAQVPSAVAAAARSAAGGVNGSGACAATARLGTLGTQISELTGAQGAVATGLDTDAATVKQDVESGTYGCGVAQYKSGDFSDSLSTMNGFISTYPHDRNVPLARKFTIAAQVAQQEPDAGKHLPTLTSGGDISVTILNDSPDTMQILYTGPATGSVLIKACGSCTAYSLLGNQSTCGNGSIDYPQVTIDMPAGTTYFLQESSGASTTPHGYSEQLSEGFDYTECAYETIL